MLRHFPSAFAALIVGALAGGGATVASAQAPRDPGAQQNVRQSEQYESALRASAGFRAQRLDKECGPINDPQLHASCVASFNADNGGGDSGMPPRSSRPHHPRHRVVKPAASPQ